MPRAFAIGFGLLLLSGAATLLCGQAHLSNAATAPVDLTKTSTKFKPGEAPKQPGYSTTKQPELNQRYKDQPLLEFEDWKGKSSRLNGKKSRFDPSDIKKFKDYRSEKLDLTSKEYKTHLYRESGKMDPRYDKATQRDNYLAAKYRDAWTAKLGPTGRDMIDFSKKLSMRDINRFQFRKSHSAAEGLPVQVAGAQGAIGQDRPLEYTLFSNYDAKPRSTGYIREAPKPAPSLLESPTNSDKKLTLGGRGFVKQASSPTPSSSNKIQPGQMIPRSVFDKMGQPTKGKWVTSSRVLD